MTQHVSYNKTSPYANTVLRNSLVEYLDFIDFIEIPSHDSDEILTVSTKFHQRPDLLSNNLYDTPDLWWIFVVRNPDQMIDPIYDLVADLDLFVPTKQRIFGLLGA